MYLSSYDDEWDLARLRGSLFHPPKRSRTVSNNTNAHYTLCAALVPFRATSLLSLSSRKLGLIFRLQYLAK
jgi:hypothetical protein